MTNMKNRRQRPRQAARRSNALSQNVPTNSTSYRGPLTTTIDTTVSTFYLDAIIATSVAGVVNGVFNNDPSLSTNWAAYASSWNEYRVLGIKFKYVPGNVVNTAVISGFTGYHSIIRGLTTPASTSLSDAASTGISRPWTAFKPWSRDWRMMDVEESAFIQTGAPATTSNTLALYASGGTASTTYGHLSIMYLVQFRGHTN